MTKDTFLAFYEGKDAGPHDANPYAADTPHWHAWRHGHESEWGERTPMTDAEVKAAWTKTCVVCGKRYSGHGHNAAPLADGYCCDACNADVILARLDRVSS